MIVKAPCRKDLLWGDQVAFAESSLILWSFKWYLRRIFDNNWGLWGFLGGFREEQRRREKQGLSKFSENVFCQRCPKKSRKNKQRKRSETDKVIYYSSTVGSVYIKSVVTFLILLKCFSAIVFFPRIFLRKTLDFINLYFINKRLRRGFLIHREKLN